jgi:hypothetical protein
MAYLDLATLLKAYLAKQPNKEAGIGLRRSLHLEPTTKEERLKAALEISAKDQVRAVLFGS